MDIGSIDMNLLVAFDALVEHRNVTRAGAAINLSQPAMSAALARLRTTLRDPLFVRTGSEMRPTPRALDLVAPVRQVLQIISTDVLRRPAFDPTTSEHSFTVMLPDIGEMTVLPRLVRLLREQAPAVRLRSSSHPRETAADALAFGTADVAIGYFPDLDAPGFHHQPLFENSYVCIARVDHPTIVGSITIDQFLAASHAVVRPDGREHLVDAHLRRDGLTRHIAAELGHFMGVLPIVTGTDVIATVPRDLADVCSQYAAVQVLDPPFDAPVVVIGETWHHSTDLDPARTWLRDLICHELGSAST